MTDMSDQGAGHAPRRSTTRWNTAAALLNLIHGTPGTTRASATKNLGLTTGAATDLLATMRAARLLAEIPVAQGRRGRPTAELRAHPNGPVAVLLDLQPRGCRIAIANIEGALHNPFGDGDSRFEISLPKVAGALTAAAQTYGPRIRIVVLCNDRRSGPTAGTEVRSIIDWIRSDNGPFRAVQEDFSLIVCNRTELEARAEARSVATGGVGTVLHLVVADGATGALVRDGEVIDANDPSGYGHLPFGRSDHLCQCGAHGCWGSSVDGYALAELCGDSVPAQPDEYVNYIAASLVSRRHRVDAKRAAFESVTTILGKSVAALVNLHNPAVVTLGGTAPVLTRTCPEVFTQAYSDGLMTIRRDPVVVPVVEASRGSQSALFGAADVALAHLRTPEALEAWCRPASSQLTDR
ncbi:ROK family protein [Rhodococcus sp. NPDC057297]|uniref:ROK family protein n=1 Tax=Rhodococcus sp. NPDC057297 TaxID=3346090 RepID=UPI003625CDEC